MGATGVQSAGSNNSNSVGGQIVALNVDNTAKTNMVKSFQQISDDFSNRLDMSKAATQNIRSEWQNIKDAADRLVKYNNVPRLSSGYAADVIFQSLQTGSIISISNASSDRYNGQWIRGTDRNNNAVWTQIADASGNRLSRSNSSLSNTPLNRGTDNFSTISNDKHTTNLRIMRFGSK